MPYDVGSPSDPSSMAHYLAQLRASRLGAPPTGLPAPAPFNPDATPWERMTGARATPTPPGSLDAYFAQIRPQHGRGPDTDPDGTLPPERPFYQPTAPVKPAGTGASSQELPPGFAVPYAGGTYTADKGAPVPAGSDQDAAKQQRLAAANMVASSARGMFSDERMKSAVENAPPDEQDATARSFKQKEWQYSAKAQRELGLPGDRRISPMAQDVESTPLGAQAVTDTEDGKMLDRDKMIGLNSALLGRLADRVDALEGKSPKKPSGRILSDEKRKDAVEAVGKAKVDEALRALARTETDEFTTGPGGDAKYMAWQDRREPIIEGAGAGDRVRVHLDPLEHENAVAEVSPNPDYSAEYTVGPGGSAQFTTPNGPWRADPGDLPFEPGARVRDRNISSADQPDLARPAPPPPAANAWRNAEFTPPPPGQVAQFFDLGTPVRGDEVVGGPQRAREPTDDGFGGATQLSDSELLRSLAALRGADVRGGT